MILPYVYKLIHKETNQFYFGSRYKNVKMKLKSEEDLGKRYKSSSDIVKSLGFENFKYFVYAEFFDWTDAYDFEQQLIKENINDELCINKSYYENGVRFVNKFHTAETKQKISKANKGKNKETCPNKQKRADEMTGQTKETSEHVAKISKTITGRTKETHEYIQIRTERMISTLTGRTKEDFEYLRILGEKQQGVPKPLVSVALKGRTKETHEYIETANNKKRGRNKYTYEAFTKMSNDFKKLTPLEENKLFEMKEAGISNKVIFEYFEGKIKYPSVSSIYGRLKKEKLNQINSAPTK